MKKPLADSSNASGSPDKLCWSSIEGCSMKKSFWVLLCLALLSLIIYARTVNYPFEYDDSHVIELNQSIRHMSNLPRFFISPHLMEPNRKAITYRPLLYATYTLNYAISGLAPWSYRALDILLHILCSFLVYLIALTVIKERGGGPAWPAAAAAIIFCVHPVQTESVIYASARSALLVCTLFMASTYFYLNARTRGGRTWTALSLAAFALALLTKETAAALLPFFFAMELYFKTKKGKAFSWSFTAAAFAITAVYSAVRLYLAFGTGSEMAGDKVVHWAGWISAFPTYIRLLLFPFWQSIYYPYPGESLYYPQTIQTVPLLFGSVVIIFLIFLLVRQFLRKNYLMASFLLLAALSFLPEFVFLIVDVVVEYRLYLPLAALCIAGAAALARVSRPRLLEMAKYGTAAAALVFSILAFTRAGVWASEESVWKDAAMKYPKLMLPHMNLGHYYDGVKDFRAALEELQVASSVSPSDARIYYDTGVTYMGLGLFPQAENAFSLAVSLDASYARYRALETVYIIEGKDEKALQNYALMAEKYPDHDVLDDVSGVALKLGRADLAQAFRRVPLK
jgi:tetratricopeptide (TPR) repeat protein